MSRLILSHIFTKGARSARCSGHSTNAISSYPAKSIVTRTDFLDAAGGVLESQKSYKNWRSKDKRENFWDFFFGEEREWVKSVYGKISVEQLFEDQRYSIEHIIPRSDLVRLLQDAPSSVRNGATVNPFNFLPAHATLNSMRSNYPFDVESDSVAMPFKIPKKVQEVEPGSTGLDAEKEWIIPEMSRGDIARAILYMVIVYDLRTVYSNQMDVLANWALADLPQDWEVEYNSWVLKNQGISNPFVEYPELAGNESLLNSVVMSD